jgi:hypothetical protein
MKKISVGLILLLLIVGHAQADTLYVSSYGEFSSDIQDITFGFADNVLERDPVDDLYFNNEFTVPQFDPTLGTLESVSMDWTPSIGFYLSLSTVPGPGTIPGLESLNWLKANATYVNQLVTDTGFPGLFPTTFPSVQLETTSTTTYVGPGDWAPNTSSVSYSDTRGTQSVVFIDPTSISYFEGSGTLSITQILTLNLGEVDGSEGTGVAGLYHGFGQNANTMRLIYEYVPATSVPDASIIILLGSSLGGLVGFGRKKFKE